MQAFFDVRAVQWSKSLSTGQYQAQSVLGSGRLKPVDLDFANPVACLLEIASHLHAEPCLRCRVYLFTVKGNQPTLQDDIRLLLAETIARRAPDFMNEGAKPEHGRRERRSIWVSNGLNHYLNFPGVGQVFAIRRETREVKSAKRRCETAYGVTSLTPEAASAPGTVRRT